MHTILIVDDVQTERELSAKVVTHLGHRAIFAEDGEKAMAMARADKPSLILLDVVMPVQDGFKTCRSLKQEPSTAKIPIVLVTSKGADFDKFWGKKQGADDHLVKPYTPDALMAMIRRYAP